MESTFDLDRPVMQKTLRIAVAAAVLLAGCTPPQRIYSTSPVDRYGQPLPLEQVYRVRFEDGSVLDIPDDKVLTLREDSFELVDSRGYTDEELPAWPITQVDEIEWRTVEGDLETAKVRTPDDLREYDRLPRVYRIDLSDGQRIDLHDNPQEPTWSASGLELEVVHEDGTAESIPLEEIETVVLHDSSVLKSTIGSPKFWLATGAGLILFFVIADQASDQDNATK
jgi:hypothetical protein